MSESSSNHALDVRTWSPRGKVLAAIAALVVVAVTMLALTAGDGDSDAASQPSVSTTEVTEQDLVDGESVTGTLEFGGSVELATQQSGTITRTATEGKTVKRNGVLWRVDQAPTILMYGEVPAYRTLQVDSSGADVRQLEKNLSKLGYDGFTVDNYYSSGTADAVARWQADVGLSETGVLTLGQVAFAPGAVRVASVQAPVGSLVQPGAAVLTVTGSDRVVSIDLDTADQSLASLDDQVVVTLPDGQEVNAKITSIGTIATSATAGDAQEGGETQAMISVVVELNNPGKAKQWDSAPVDVALEASRVEDALTVPVTALLALSEGGFAVEVVTAEGAAPTLVAVETGLFAQGRVQITGEGITAGTVVAVPAK